MAVGLFALGIAAAAAAAGNPKLEEKEGETTMMLRVAPYANFRVQLLRGLQEDHGGRH